MTARVLGAKIVYPDTQNLQKATFIHVFSSCHLNVTCRLGYMRVMR